MNVKPDSIMVWYEPLGSNPGNRVAFCFGDKQRSYSNPTRESLKRVASAVMKSNEYTIRPVTIGIVGYSAYRKGDITT